MISDKRVPVWAGAKSLKREDETLDTLFEGKLKLFQGQSGYRFSLDALLLAHFMTCRNGEKIIDLGTGNGVIALILAYLHSSLSITGVETQPSMIDRASRNVRLNEFQKRVTIAQADVTHIQKAFSPESFAAVVCIRAARTTTSGRINPNSKGKKPGTKSPQDLPIFCAPGLICCPIRTNSIGLSCLAHRRRAAIHARRESCSPTRLRMVHSFADAKAALVLTEGVKGGRSGIEVLSPLIVYQQGKQYTAEVETMLAGSAPLC